MGENEVPINIGLYKCVVTVSVNDSNCILENGQMNVENSFEFEIYKHIIDVSKLGFNQTFDENTIVEYVCDGSDYREKALESLSYYETQKFIKWEVTVIAHLVETEWQRIDDAIWKDTYKVIYKIQVLNSSSCVFLLNGQEYAEINIIHYFKIV